MHELTELMHGVIPRFYRVDWLVEAACNKGTFTRGAGAQPFPKWPDKIITETVQI